MEDFSLGAAPKSNLDTILSAVEKLEEKDLVRLRSRLDEILNIGIGDLNLGEELSLQLRRAQRLLAGIENDDKVSTKDKSQMLNTIQNQLDKIIKQRQVVFSQERLKRYEAAMLKCLESLGTDEQRTTFLELYGSFLEDRGE